MATRNWRANRRERDGHQIVVNKQQDPAAADRTGSVHRQRAAQLRLRGAVALVELDERRRRCIREGCEATPQPCDGMWERHTAAAACGASRLDWHSACRKSSSPFERELNGPCLRDVAALA
jgi:hypothetical protein